MVSDFSKLMLRAYNAEAEYAVRGMRPHKLHSLTDRLDKSRSTIARLGQTMNIAITEEYHRLRIQELELTADFLAKQEKERRREQQRRRSCSARSPESGPGWRRSANTILVRSPGSRPPVRRTFTRARSWSPSSPRSIRRWWRSTRVRPMSGRATST
jgi:Domain of unknown function (DUF4041)